MGKTVTTLVAIGFVIVGAKQGLAACEQDCQKEPVNATWSDVHMDPNSPACEGGVGVLEDGTVRAEFEGVKVTLGSRPGSVLCRVYGVVSVPEGYRISAEPEANLRSRAEFHREGDRLRLRLGVRQASQRISTHKGLAYEGDQKGPMTAVVESRVGFPGLGSCEEDLAKRVSLSALVGLNYEDSGSPLSVSLQDLSVEPLKLEPLDCEDQ